MRSSFKFATAAAVAAIMASALAMPAAAECKRFGFLVNDYGKDGPTKDAKELLGKTIASKMAERGIKDYKTGTKTVTCELFLNFIVFDEHTCTAEATVCWGGSELPKGQQSAAKDDSDSSEPAAETPKTVSHEKHKSSKSHEATAKAESDGASPAADSKSEQSAKAEETSKPESPAPAKKAVAAKSSGNGVADPVKPRIASAATPATSSVVTGSVDAPQKKETAKSETKRKASSDDTAGYPQALAPTAGQ